MKFLPSPSGPSPRVSPESRTVAGRTVVRRAVIRVATAQVAVIAGALCVAGASGCGGSDPAPPTEAADGAAADPATATAESAADAGRFAPFTDPAGRKWLNKTIPYDAFATAPERSGGGATVAASTAGPRNLLAGIGSGMGGSRGAMPTATAPGTMAPGTTAPGTTAPAGPDGAPMMSMGGGGEPDEGTGDDPGGWGAVISAEDLRDEIKQVRNGMAAAVSTVAAFNRAQAELPGDAAVLAALAQITADHPGRVPWKQHADAVRTLAVRVGEAAGSRGRPGRDAARDSFDPLDSILGGNPPPDNAVAEFDRQLDAPRGDLMNRMAAALKYLQQEAPDADVMAENAADLGRQAATLAALSRFTAHEAYENASEPDYQQWANALTAAANDAANGARTSKDYPAYRAAVDRAAAACADCHGTYR